MTAFNRNQVQQDLSTLRTIYQQFFEGILDSDWERKTGERDKDWTLAETVAHLATIAELFNMAIFAARRGIPDSWEGIKRREDLREWNQREISKKLNKNTPEKLVEQFDKELAQAITYADLLTDHGLTQETLIPIYNRPAPLAHFVIWQLSHAGVVHGAQLSRAVDQAPLWERHSSEMAQRQVERFLIHWSWAYWHTIAPKLNVTLHFRIEGDYGSDWTLVAAPDGGKIQPGAPDQADYIYTYKNPSVLFSLSTFNETFETAMKHGEFQISGENPQHGLRLLSLFAASPPRNWTETP